MISVIVTCYNLEKYLLEAIESVKAQTVFSGEIIIIHDGCSKPALVPGTTTVFREENIGVARSRDQGVKIAKEKLLLFLDADDVLPEDFIAESIETIKNASIAYPNILLWCHWSEKPKPNEMHKAPNKITLENLLKFNQVTVTSLMSKDVYDKVGGFDPLLPIWEDWEFFIKACKAGFSFKKTNTYLKYRQRENSRNHQDDELKKKIHLQVSSKYAIKKPAKYAKK